jgi:diaminopimelate epimerase
LKFTKLHALGNDFLVMLPSEELDFSVLGDLARRICDRHMGVGADGLLVIHVKDAVEGKVLFRIFNPDGTEAELSGNGLRCAAAALHYHKVVDRPTILFQTPAGPRTCEILENHNPLFDVRVDMGTPKFSSTDIPFDDGQDHDRIVDYPMHINRKTVPVTCVSMGNPHAGIFFDRFPARIEWHQIGREIEVHPFFPNRTNVEFIRVINPGSIEVLFWERGVGETLSSGTGSSAAAVASTVKGLTEKKVRVWTPMGQFMVEMENERVLHTGPAEAVFVGTFPSS